MPVPKDQMMSEGTAVEGKKAVVAPAVENFLKDNSGEGYSTKEIADALGFNTHTVNSTVLRLAKNGKIERRSVKGVTYNVWAGGEE